MGRAQATRGRVSWRASRAALRCSLAVTGALSLAACGQSSGAPHTDWTQVAERTTCEALNPASCVGLFGFAVTADGRYTIGPAPSGQSVSGTLSAQELAQLSAAAGQVAGGKGASPQCDSGASVPGVSDAVDLTVSDGTVIRAYEQSFQGTCTRGGRDAALRLHDDLHALMQRYYPTPFPS